jgi:hypothetical protein
MANHKVKSSEEQLAFNHVLFHKAETAREKRLANQQQRKLRPEILQIKNGQPTKVDFHKAEIIHIIKHARSLRRQESRARAGRMAAAQFLQNQRLNNFMFHVTDLTD